MRKTVRSLIIILTINSLFLVACSKKNKDIEDVITIDLIEATKTIKQLNLSELVDDVEYVKLETTDESTFGTARYLVTENYIVVYETYKATIRLFSREGKFIRKIGRKGQGPGEFYRISNIIVFPSEDYLIVHDGGFSKIVKYSISGEFVQEEVFPRTEKILTGITLTEPDCFALTFNRPVRETENFPLILIWNKSFESVDSLFPISTPLIENSYVSYGNSLYIKDDILHFREGFFDTLYAYRNKTFVPEFHMLIKENKQPNYARNLNDHEFIYSRVGALFELGDFLLCNFDTPGEEKDEIIGYWILFNQQTGDLFTLPELRWYLRDSGTEPAIFNDVDGIHHIYMNNYTNTLITHFTENLIYKAIDMVDLKSYIEQKEYEKIAVRFPSKQQELIHLVNNSDVEDNPIVQIFHCSQ